MNAEEIQIPEPINLSASAQTALEYASSVIDADHLLNNGKTSLFWHLVSTAAKHIGDANLRPMRRAEAEEEVRKAGVVGPMSDNHVDAIIEYVRTGGESGGPNGAVGESELEKYERYGSGLVFRDERDRILRLVGEVRRLRRFMGRIRVENIERDKRLAKIKGLHIYGFAKVCEKCGVRRAYGAGTARWQNRVVCLDCGHKWSQ
jgi:hypothetical protein